MEGELLLRLIVTPPQQKSHKMQSRSRDTKYYNIYMQTRDGRRTMQDEQGGGQESALVISATLACLSDFRSSIRSPLM